MSEKQKHKVRVRSAPSPTGRPHIGTCYNALFNCAFARGHGGKFILRIEDTDRSRYDPRAEEEIFELLGWLNLEPDESPKAGGDYGPYRQSERLDVYQKYAQRLVEQGDAYYCFCSPERLEKVRARCRARGEPPMYDRCCRELDPREARERAEADESYVIRLKVPLEGSTKFHDVVRGDITVENYCIDDQVLLKSDGFPTYHLANVVDDHLMEITHIIRGEEWLSSVPKHIVLYDAFGWEPPIYAHTPLLRGEDGSKLGKRRGAQPALEYRKQGYLPEALLNYLALLGWTHPEEKEFFDLEEMIGEFELEDLDATAPVYDEDKLKWLNGKWMRSFSIDELSERLLAFLDAEIINDKEIQISGYPDTRITPERFSQIVSLVQERMETLRDFEELARFFFQAPEVDRELLIEQAHGSEKEAKAILAAAIEILKAVRLPDCLPRGEALRGQTAQLSNCLADELEEAFRKKADEHGWGMRAICMVARVAITGKTASPPLFDCISVLGREETLSRLRAALKLL